MVTAAECIAYKQQQHSQLVTMVGGGLFHLGVNVSKLRCPDLEQSI